jgi:CDGSH-type Zn-finger protein
MVGQHLRRWALGNSHRVQTVFSCRVLYDSGLAKREKRYVMGACACGHTRDEEKNCDGTHKVVKAVKAELAEKLEANGFPHASEYVKNN